LYSTCLKWKRRGVTIAKKHRPSWGFKKLQEWVGKNPGQVENERTSDGTKEHRGEKGGNSAAKRMGGKWAAKKKMKELHEEESINLW